MWINIPIPRVAEMSHGGYQDSGYGKDLSAYAPTTTHDSTM